MSIASRITSMENNIRNAYHGLDSIGIDTTNTNKNIENISALLDDFYDTLPKVSGSGSNIQLTPTRKGRITSQINGDTFQQTYTGKNLFNKNGQLTLGARLASNGTSYYTGASDYYISEWIKIDGNTTYTKNSPTADAYHRVCFYTSNNSDTFISYSETNTFTTPATATYLRFCGLQTELDTTQLEQGSTATSFEPFVGGTASPNPQFPQSIQSVTGTQNITISDGTNTDTYTIHLGNIELNKIGDYKDYITGSPNNWSIVKQIGTRILNGSESWSAISMTNNYGYYVNFTNILAPSSSSEMPKSLCNYFTLKTPSNQWTSPAGDKNYTVINTSATYTAVRFSVGDNTNKLTEFKTWLSNNNVEVDYVLATPTTTPITDTTLINDLNTFYYAMSKNGETNISVDGSLPIILDASVLKGEE